jgi:asparagine synthase (glutamine-hydrolysing)
MTLIAGILGRRKGLPINPSDCEQLKHAISRNHEDKVRVFQDGCAFLAKVDVGAYGTPAFQVSRSGSVAILAGEFLLSAEAQNIYGNRDSDLRLLHQSWDRDDWGGLAKAEGVFCAVHYAPSSATLTLIADKLGLRPLYYWMDSEHVVFASALRILESLSFVPKTMDMRGVTELVAFGYPLGKRTPYSNLNLMSAGEILRISRTSARSQRYWRWDKITSSNLAEPERIEKLNQDFRLAVKKRLRGDTATVSFLSGGLDSRCVVAALREQNAKVYTFNFGFPGAQDQVFAAAFARASGTVHLEGSMPLGAPRWSLMISDAWSAPRPRASPLPEHPQILWSGDGGSVSLGHVYLSRRIVDQMCEGKVDSAVDTFLTEQRMHVPERLFQPHVATRLRDLLGVGIREELADIQCDDRGRAFHLFLMLNDQRRHLSIHFEDIDLHRLELQLPFFDSQFLSTIMTFPVEACLGHGIYTQWLKKLPATVTSVPWQTYPSHDPCPLPGPKEAAYQWSDSELFRGHRRAKKQKLISEVYQILVGDSLPKVIIRKEVVWAAACLCWVGIRDYSYLLDAARTYSSFWKSSGSKSLSWGSTSAPAKPSTVSTTESGQAEVRIL